MGRVHKWARALIGALLLAVGVVAVVVTSSPASAATPLPAHAVTGYWQNFNNGATLQNLRDVPSNYDIIAVAFADATGDAGRGVASRSTRPSGSRRYSSTDVHQGEHAAGRPPVIISIGGQNGTINVRLDVRDELRQLASTP